MIIAIERSKYGRTEGEYGTRFSHAARSRRRLRAVCAIAAPMSLLLTATTAAIPFDVHQHTIAIPSFDVHENANNVYGRVPSPKTNGTGVVFSIWTVSNLTWKQRFDH